MCLCGSTCLHVCKEAYRVLFVGRLVLVIGLFAMLHIICCDLGMGGAVSECYLKDKCKLIILLLFYFSAPMVRVL